MSDDGIFDAGVAETYDAVHATPDPEMINRLAELAADGPILEFAVGTGRVAMPLAERGASIHGIELSRPMVEKLREKDRENRVGTTIGDMTTTRVRGSFSLVFLVYNTIDNLTTQDAQIACFQNAAHHLSPGGRFVVETLVPPIQKLPFGERLLAQDHSDSHWGIDEFDVVTQAYWSHHARFDQSPPTRISVPFRYAWPAELDLMARMAGMELEERWSNWSGAPFTATSRSHISVWRKPRAT